jgi:alpha-galactosidase
MDDFTLSLLTNDEVLAIDQDPLGQEARRVKEDAKIGIEIWSRPLSDGATAVGLFNRGRYEIEPPPRPKKGEPAPKPIWKLRDRATGKATEFETEADAQAELKKSAETIEITADWSDLHLKGSQPVRDLWRQKDLGAADGKVSAKVAPHGAVLLKIGKPQVTK